MKKYSLLITYLSFFLFAPLLNANTLGFGIRGEWGGNFLGFKGQREGNKAETGPGQVFSSGGFIEYNIGEDDKKEPITVSLDISYSRRTIQAVFPKDKKNKGRKYYDQVFKTFTLNYLDLEFNLFWQAVRFDHGAFGPYIGIGGLYMLNGWHADRDLEPTTAQREDIKDSLDAFNLLAAAGIKCKFLDSLLAGSLGVTYTFFNQSKNLNNRLKKEYGDNASIGQGQLGVVASISINIWEMIRG